MDAIADLYGTRHHAGMVEISGRSYGVTVGSDIRRDGMFLEVRDETAAVLAEVFYSDRDDSMTFTGYRADLPLPLVAWMVAQAEKRLTPRSGKGSQSLSGCH